MDRLLQPQAVLKITNTWVSDILGVMKNGQRP